MPATGKARQSANAALCRLQVSMAPPNARAMFRAWSLAVALACGVPDPGWAVAQSSFQRVRAIDGLLLQGLHDGFRRSATFRQLVLILERSNVIVYVLPGFCEVGRITGCLLRFVEVAGTDRYLRIVVSRVLSEERLIAVVGHELQHAREVAAAESVTDSGSMLALFRRTGLRQCRNVLAECYETRAAIEVEDAILKELGKQQHFFRP